MKSQNKCRLRIPIKSSNRIIRSQTKSSKIVKPRIEYIHQIEFVFRFNNKPIQLIAKFRYEENRITQKTDKTDDCNQTANQHPKNRNFENIISVSHTRSHRYNLLKETSLKYSFFFSVSLL